MSGLAEWIEAQIAADERCVTELRESDYGDRTLIEEPWFEEGIYTPDISDFGGLWISPARVLAECEAKRAIIELLSDNPVRPRHYDFVQADDQERVADRLFYDMARLLALPYADRPGFREEWRPQ